MLRDPALAPLSRQHHHALVLAIRIQRALKSADFDAQFWQAEITSLAGELEAHFQAEEDFLFPAAQDYEPLRPVISELLQEHASLRKFLGGAASGQLSSAELDLFASLIENHIRKEERRLFEGVQRHFSGKELQRIGTEIARAFGQAHNPSSISLPLRPHQ